MTGPVLTAADSGSAGWPPPSLLPGLPAAFQLQLCPSDSKFCPLVLSTLPAAAARGARLLLPGRCCTASPRAAGGCTLPPPSWPSQPHPSTPGAGPWPTPSPTGPTQLWRLWQPQWEQKMPPPTRGGPVERAVRQAAGHCRPEQRGRSGWWPSRRSAGWFAGGELDSKPQPAPSPRPGRGRLAPENPAQALPDTS